MRGGEGGCESAMYPHESERRGPVFHVYFAHYHLASVYSLYMQGPTYIHKLEVLKFAAARCALERFTDAQSRCADAVRDIYDARQFFQLGEESRRYCR